MPRGGNEDKRYFVKTVKSTLYETIYWFNNTRKYFLNYCGLLMPVSFSLKEKAHPLLLQGGES